MYVGGNGIGSTVAVGVAVGTSGKIMKVPPAYANLELTSNLINPDLGERFGIVNVTAVLVQYWLLYSGLKWASSIPPPSRSSQT